MFDKVTRQALVQDLVSMKDLAIKINKDMATETSKTVGPAVTRVKSFIARKIWGEPKSESDIPELE